MTEEITRSLSSASVQDAFGIEYLIENAQQFWSALEDVLVFPANDYPTLSMLDSALQKFMELCIANHEQYLQSPLQIDHACTLLLDSELFAFHSDRMSGILFDDAKMATDPHTLFITYHILLAFGRRRPESLKNTKRWEPLLPLLMDYILVDVDPAVEDTFFGSGPASSDGVHPEPTPIEVKLRSLAVRVLYEVCRAHKLPNQGLRIFNESFIDRLFDLVEETRNMQDETFNYSVIKLIVALNEQYMVASLHHSETEPSKDHGHNNIVLTVLMRRLGHCQTFGENMIFMLNRAGRTSEDLCMQLLVLKLLYLLFTNRGTEEFFYTNDLRVLVDVFLRELVDLDEDSESLRHTYLRVLHPLLTKTQLRDVPYKRPQIVCALESLLQDSPVREVNPTTKRLAERCLGGSWCVQFRKPSLTASPLLAEFRVDSPSNESVASTTQARAPRSESGMLAPSLSKKTLKSSKSMEFRQPHPTSHSRRSHLDDDRRPNNSSSQSLTGVASAELSLSSRRKTSVASVDVDISATREGAGAHRSIHSVLSPPMSASSLDLPSSSSAPTVHAVSTRRSPPPIPTAAKRRKPPAVPSSRAKMATNATDSGTVFMTIKASSP